jgi:imidazole glycerol phosphate synthase subunit HisF
MKSRLTIVALCYGGGTQEMTSIETALRLNGNVRMVCVHPNAGSLNKSDEDAIERLVRHFGEDRVVVMKPSTSKNIERGEYVIRR